MKKIRLNLDVIAAVTSIIAATCIIVRTFTPDKKEKKP